MKEPGPWSCGSGAGQVRQIHGKRSLVSESLTVRNPSLFQAVQKTQPMVRQWRENGEPREPDLSDQQIHRKGSPGLAGRGPSLFFFQQSSNFDWGNII